MDLGTILSIVDATKSQKQNNNALGIDYGKIRDALSGYLSKSQEGGMAAPASNPLMETQQEDVEKAFKDEDKEDETSYAKRRAKKPGDILLDTLTSRDNKPHKVIGQSDEEYNNALEKWSQREGYDSYDDYQKAEDETTEKRANWKGELERERGENDAKNAKSNAFRDAVMAVANYSTYPSAENQGLADLVTAGYIEQYPEGDNPEGGEKTQPKNDEPHQRKSQRQEYIDFLGTDEGQAWLALHGGQGFDDATYGYENLRASGDMGAWGDLLGYNPDVAGINSWRGRYGSAGVDLNDIASLEDYLYGSNAISQAAFDAALIGQGDFDVSKFGEGDDFENMAKYMLENSGYGPDLIAALEKSGLDANDFAALAMATGASQGTFNPSDVDVNRILGAAGEGAEVGIGDDYTMQWGAPNRDYQLSDIMNARGLNKNDTRSYGNVTIDDDLLPYMMAQLDKGQPEGKRYGAKKRS